MPMWIRKNDKYYDVKVRVFTYDNGGLGIDLCDSKTGKLFLCLTHAFCQLNNPSCCLFDDGLSWVVADAIEFLYDNDLAIYAGAKVISNVERAYIFRCNLEQLLKVDPQGTEAYLRFHGITPDQVTDFTDSYYDDQANLILVG